MAKKPRIKRRTFVHANGAHDGLQPQDDVTHIRDEYLADDGETVAETVTADLARIFENQPLAIRLAARGVSELMQNNVGTDRSEMPVKCEELIGALYAGQYPEGRTGIGVPEALADIVAEIKTKALAAAGKMADGETFSGADWLAELRDYGRGEDADKERQKRVKAAKSHPEVKARWADYEAKRKAEMVRKLKAEAKAVDKAEAAEAAAAL